jgi:hypothetical protein
MNNNDNHLDTTPKPELFVNHEQVIERLRSGILAKKRIRNTGWSTALLAELLANALESPSKKEPGWITIAEITAFVTRQIATERNNKKTRQKMCAAKRGFLDHDGLLLISVRGGLNQYLKFRVFDDTATPHDKTLAHRELLERQERNQITQERVNRINKIISQSFLALEDTSPTEDDNGYPKK